MKYIALDCHKQYDHATMIDTETGEIKNKKMAHIKEEFREFIGDEIWPSSEFLMNCWGWNSTQLT